MTGWVTVVLAVAATGWVGLSVVLALALARAAAAGDRIRDDTRRLSAADVEWLTRQGGGPRA